MTRHDATRCDVWLGCCTCRRPFSSTLTALELSHNRVHHARSTSWKPDSCHESALQSTVSPWRYVLKTDASLALAFCLGLVPSIGGERYGSRRRRDLTPLFAKPSLEFIRGVEEKSVPDVRLTRSMDGSNGTAMFRFESPSVLSESEELGDITGEITFQITQQLTRNTDSMHPVFCLF